MSAVGIHDFRSLQSSPCFADVVLTDETGLELTHLVPANGSPRSLKVPRKLSFPRQAWRTLARTQLLASDQYLGSGRNVRRSSGEAAFQSVSPTWRRFSPLHRSRLWRLPHPGHVHALTTQASRPVGPVNDWQLLHLRVELASFTFSTTRPARWPMAFNVA